MSDQETTFTSEDAERIRRQERTKLQGTIDRLETEVARLQNLQSANPADALSQVLAKVDSALSSNRKTEMVGELADIKAALTNLAQTKNTPAPVADNPEIGSLRNELDTLKQTLGALTNDYKAAMEKVTTSTKELMILQAIKDAGRPLIEELVGGSTKEEIMASVQRAAEVYDKYHKPAVNTTEPKNTSQELPSGEVSAPTPAGSTPVTTPDNTVTTAPTPIGSGPTPLDAPSTEQIISNLQNMTARERATYFAQNPDAMRRLAEIDFNRTVKAGAGGPGLT